MNSLQLYLDVFIIVFGGGVCQKTLPGDRLFNLQGTILTLPCKGIVLLVVHWIFHNNIIIWVKVLCIIILMVIFIGRIGRWCFCGTCRGWLPLRDLLTDLQNPFNKVVKIFVISFSVNDFLSNCCRSNFQECNKTVKTVLLGICASACFMRRTLHLFESSENSLKRQECLDNFKSL